MCAGCFAAYDVAPIDGDVRAAAAAIEALYEQHPTGGLMHVAVDDWNLEDQTVAWCGFEQVAPGAERALDPVESDCFVKLIRITEAQRATALAIHYGFHDAPTGKRVTDAHIASWRDREIEP